MVSVQLHLYVRRVVVQVLMRGLQEEPQLVVHVLILVQPVTKQLVYGKFLILLVFDANVRS